MKKLVTIIALVLGLNFSATSFATELMNLYTKPVTKNEVIRETKGKHVEGDHMSFYLSSKETNTRTSVRAEEETNDENTHTVFGVQISRR